MLKKALFLISLITASVGAPAMEKESLDIAGNYAAINAAANLFLNSLGPNFTGTPEGHIQTDIAGAGAIAGLVLLRETVPNLNEYTPGDILISEVHEGQSELLWFMGRVAGNMGLEADAGWADPVPVTDKPIMDTLELTKRLEPPFIAACNASNLSPRYRKFAAALAAMKLVQAGHEMKILNQNVGKPLAFYYVVAGSKTAPHPVRK